MTVREICEIVDSLAHFENQEPYDNSGFLVGSGSAEVKRILCALDVTERVIDEALASGANLIITHHPLMFSPRQTVTDGDYEGRLIMRLIRENIALIAAHTCLDKAEGGINDALAAACGLSGVTGEGFVRVGSLPRPMTIPELRDHLSSSLKTTVRLMGRALPEDAENNSAEHPAKHPTENRTENSAKIPSEPSISILGLCSGAGGSEWKEAAALGAQAFLSGEIKHHLALEMADAGIPAYECGHYATEQPGVFALAKALQSRLNQVEYKLGIFVSDAADYVFPSRS